jgi:RND family efflux transporter MFP subunit
VALDVAALHKEVRGTVARTADRLDSDTRTMRVEVDVDNANRELVPGMYANASLLLDEARGALLAPIEAVNRTGATSTVVVVNDRRRIELRPVELGLESADRIEIRSGVHDGELVVVGNRAQLKAGLLVQPKIRAAAAADEGAH